MGDTFDKILKTATLIIQADLLQGHLKWKVTEIAKKGFLARSTIYEYFGKNKEEILQASLKIILDELFGLSSEREEIQKLIPRRVALFRSRDLVTQAPELLSFYFKYRSKQSKLGIEIREAEEKYMKTIASQTGVNDSDLLLALRVFIHGLSLAPFLSEEDVTRSLNVIDKLIKNEVK